MNDGFFETQIHQQEKISYITVVTGEVFLSDTNTIKLVAIRCSLEIGVGEVQVDVFLGSEMSFQPFHVLCFRQGVVFHAFCDDDAVIEHFFFNLVSRND